MGMKRKPFYTPQPTPTQRMRDRKRAVFALGKPLAKAHPVHHHSLTQLVICENQSYHWLLHRRTVAKRFGYDCNVVWACYCCQKPKPVAEFLPTRKFCKACQYPSYMDDPAYLDRIACEALASVVL